MSDVKRARRTYWHLLFFSYNAARQTFETGKGRHTGNDGEAFGIDAKEQRGPVGRDGVHCRQQVQSRIHRVFERSEPVSRTRTARSQTPHAALEHVFQQGQRRDRRSQGPYAHSSTSSSSSSSSNGRVQSAAALGFQSERHTAGRARFVLRRSARAHPTAKRRHRSRFAVPAERHVAVAAVDRAHSAFHAVLRFFGHRVTNARQAVVVLLDGQQLRQRGHVRTARSAPGAGHQTPEGRRTVGSRTALAAVVVPAPTRLIDKKTFLDFLLLLLFFFRLNRRFSLIKCFYFYTKYTPPRVRTFLLLIDWRRCIFFVPYIFG